jgi:hypothetical protein
MLELAGDYIEVGSFVLGLYSLREWGKRSKKQ